ncbi:hypothetical protein KC573_01340, partial [candidate division WWE3 bacterium]|nr:hypothetical protein [candidate division WWE3 bacterium]
MYFYQTSQNRVRKTASALLAVILLISPLGNIAFAGATEDTAWVYDVARVAGQTSVIGQYGDYRESYAIDVPPGTNGLTPILQLSYSSQADGYGSSVGYGWSLFSPAVVRLNKNGVDQIYSRSDFQSSYDGELTEADANEFIPRVQTSSFKTYTLGGTDWVTYSQDGTKYTFGSTTNARQRAYSTSTDIYAWYLDEIQDANGNKIKYEYIQSEGKVYPSKIFYGYDSLGDNAYEVDFVYASSTSYISYEPGFAVVNDRILESIVVYFDGDLITQYDLEYENPNGSTINLLNSIHKIGYSENGIAASTSPRYFEYVQESAGWTNDTSIATTAPSYLYLQVDDTGQSYTQYSRDMLLDMNADVV